MSMGIPLICNAGVGDTDLFVEKYSAGIVLKELNESAYLSNTTIEKSFNVESTKLGAKEFYGLEVGIKRYLTVYKKLI